MNSKLRELLYRSLDEQLTNDEKSELEKGLASSASLREERDQLLQMRSKLAGSAGEFKPFFESRVMQRIRSESAAVTLDRLVESLTIRFKRVAFAAAVCAVAVAAFNLTQSDELSVPAVFAIEQPSESELFQTPYEQIWE